MLKEMLPQIYSDILDDDFLNLNPQESLATCQNCYKLSSSAPRPRFNPYTKCCTYYPFLPNYLVGGILLDQRCSTGAEVIRDLIRARRYVVPLGVCVPPSYQKKFNTKKPEDFGNNLDLLCPFYLSGQGACKIWLYRGHECLTYFCHSSYGQNGEQFWGEVRQMLHELEMYLSQMTMIEGGYNHLDINSNLGFLRNELVAPGQSGWEFDSLSWSQVWGHRLEQIEDYFKFCYQFVINCRKELKKGWYENRKSSESTYTRILADLLVGGTVSKNHFARENS